LRTLPPQWRTQKIVLRASKDLEKMQLDELVGILLILEKSTTLRYQDAKANNLTLKFLQRMKKAVSIKI